MSYAEVRRIAVAEIPVIDVAPLRGGQGAAISTVGTALRRASSEIGFFYVRNHGVPDSLIERADAAARRFFSLPLEDKLRVCINRHHHGFLRVGEAKMATDAKVDLKESFVWGLDLPDANPDRLANPFLGPNNWPDFMPELRSALYPFFEAMSDCAQMLMRAFAVGLALPEDTFLKNCSKPISRSSVIYYPPQPPTLGQEQFGVSPHTDYGCLTLLWQDDVGGLEVRNVNGEWLTAHPIPGTLVVNVGDLLERWTNDKFVSTPHRVVNRRGVDRHSMVLAFDPDFETVVDPAATCGIGEPPKYEPVLCGDYVLRRFDEAFAYRRANG
jgi:isopenicillin N synthase-like dioxygenase